MFPHLIGMKESHHLSSEDMGAIIGTCRQTYEYKAQHGNFTQFECKALCRKFGRSFEYLFATTDEIDEIDKIAADRLSFADDAGDNADGGATRAEEAENKNDTDHADENQEAG